MQTHERVVAVIARQAGIAAETIGPKMRLDAPPIELDSMDRVELAMKLEEEFSISLPDEEVDVIESTVEALCIAVDKKLEGVLKLGEREAHRGRFHEATGFDWSKPGSARSTPALAAAPPLSGRDAMMRADEATRHTLIQQAIVAKMEQAFRAGVRAGRCDPDEARAWAAFKAEHRL